MICPHCGQEARKALGREFYPYTVELHNKALWVCDNCDARVGCHFDDYTKPLGELAKPHLRKLRMEAHQAFDSLWKPDRAERVRMYQELAKWLKIESKQCHIALFDESQCEKVLQFSKEQGVHTWGMKAQAFKQKKINLENSNFDGM